MPPTILVVDEDPEMRSGLTLALAGAGYAVEQASDGITALKHIARRSPDAVLMDVRMPCLDGIGLATLLAPHTPAVPIILMSANPLPRGCALPFIRKPFDLDGLLTVMARTLPVSPVATIALASLGAV